MLRGREFQARPHSWAAKSKLVAKRNRLNDMSQKTRDPYVLVGSVPGFEPEGRGTSIQSIGYWMEIRKTEAPREDLTEGD